MRRILMLSSVFCVLAASAPAQQGGDTRVVISKQDCARLVQYQPSPDVAYKPGVDVRGKPVVSADTDPGRQAMIDKLVPETLEFPVKINPMNYASRKAALRSKSSTEAAIAAGGGTATAAQNQALSSAQSKLDRMESRGYGDTTAEVAKVKYDLARNTFTINGEPLVSEDQRALAEACSRQGVR